MLRVVNGSVYVYRISTGSWQTVRTGLAMGADRAILVETDEAVEPLRAMGAHIDGREDGSLAPLADDVLFAIRELGQRRFVTAVEATAQRAEIGACLVTGSRAHRRAVLRSSTWRHAESCPTGRCANARFGGCWPIVGRAR